MKDRRFSGKKAAERFFLSPTALSQHLKRIDESLGAHLFIRTDGELRLTDIGKIYLNGARSMLYIQNEALAKINHMRADLKGSIRLIVDERTINQINKIIIPIINKKLPLIEIRLLTGYQDITKEYLLNGVADIGIMTSSNTKHEKLEFSSLHADELVLVLPSSNRLVPIFEQTGISWDMLVSDYFIISQMEDGFRSLQQEAMDRYGFRAQVLCEVETLHTARHMAANGLGDTLLPLSFLKTDDPSYRIFHLDPPDYIFTSAVYPKSVTLSKPAREVLNILHENFKKVKYCKSI